MCLFIDEIVLSGFVTACLLAVSPTNLSPSFVNATIEGVVLLPSTFAITTASPPSITATQEFVVPKSIPITLLILFLHIYLNIIFLFICFLCAQSRSPIYLLAAVHINWELVAKDLPLFFRKNTLKNRVRASYFLQILTIAGLIHLSLTV